MQWVIGAVLLALAITFVIAGAQGQATSLFQTVTGKTPTHNPAQPTLNQALGAVGGSGGFNPLSLLPILGLPIAAAPQAAAPQQPVTV